MCGNSLENFGNYTLDFPLRITYVMILCTMVCLFVTSDDHNVKIDDDLADGEGEGEKKRDRERERERERERGQEREREKKKKEKEKQRKRYRERDRQRGELTIWRYGERGDKRRNGAGPVQWQETKWGFG